jgi:hypothetical protein
MTETRARLQARLQALSEEIRHYPTPIARCDLHLAALLEARARIVEALGRLDRASARGCAPETEWADDGGRCG